MSDGGVLSSGGVLVTGGNALVGSTIFMCILGSPGVSPCAVTHERPRAGRLWAQFGLGKSIGKHYVCYVMHSPPRTSCTAGAVRYKRRPEMYIIDDYWTEANGKGKARIRIHAGSSGNGAR